MYSCVATQVHWERQACGVDNYDETGKIKSISDKNKKILVLDTNVAIDDPECLEKFGDNNLIIPIAVYEELNDIKGESHAAHR